MVRNEPGLQRERRGLYLMHVAIEALRLHPVRVYLNCRDRRNEPLLPDRGKRHDFDGDERFDSHTRIYRHVHNYVGPDLKFKGSFGSGQVILAAYAHPWSIR